MQSMQSKPAGPYNTITIHYKIDMVTSIRLAHTFRGLGFSALPWPSLHDSPSSQPRSDVLAVASSQTKSSISANTSSASDFRGNRAESIFSGSA